MVFVPKYRQRALYRVFRRQIEILRQAHIEPVKGTRCRITSVLCQRFWLPHQTTFSGVVADLTGLAGRSSDSLPAAFSPTESEKAA